MIAILEVICLHWFSWEGRGGGAQAGHVLPPPPPPQPP